MSKKAKLFTTIASLCLAVALLVFGVYAAVSATLTVKSKVFFQAQKDVYLSFDAATGLKVYTSETLGANADTTDWQEKTVEDTTKWTTVDANNAPLAKPAVGELTLDTYEFKNQTVTEAEGQEDVITPAIYGYKVVLTFDIMHDGDTYVVEMTGDEEAEATYSNLSVTFAYEHVDATEENQLANDQLVVTYYVVLTDTDSNIGQLDEEFNLQPDDLNLTFTFERESEQVGG